MEHKGKIYLMEHKDTKTQRIRQSSAKGSALKDYCVFVKKNSASLRPKKNFVSLCLCVHLN